MFSMFVLHLLLYHSLAPVLSRTCLYVCVSISGAEFQMRTPLHVLKDAWTVDVMSLMEM